uniref:Reverse transcriptase domain-containing protein n=1 Tax=Cannabis sativa TaxID=3483 RepID=A0A803PAS2_CANSA
MVELSLFSAKFVNWIMTCLKGTSYNLMMNGRLQGKFKGKKGLRQGDPISPLLFVLVMEFLTRRLLQESKEGTSQVVNHLKVALNDFSKSVPMRPTKWRMEDCGAIVDKIKKRLHSWATRHLSYAGRIQLIHTALLGLRNYWMNIFVLRQSVIKEIDKHCRLFLWGQAGNRCKVHLGSWEEVCRPKQYGGLGFREGANWNKAILAKFLWAIMKKHDVLWVKWVNVVYLKGVDIWNYKLSQYSS